MLDAPALADDFYLNLVDWSAQNLLAVGLDSCVYLWSAHTSKVGPVYGWQSAGVCIITPAHSLAGCGTLGWAISIAADLLISPQPAIRVVK